MRSVLGVLLAGMLLLGAVSGAEAQASGYKIIKLEPYTGTGTWQTWANGINKYRYPFPGSVPNDGQFIIVGISRSNNVNHASCWRVNGDSVTKWATLSSLGGANSEAYGIDGFTTVVGRAETNTGGWHACTWNLPFDIQDPCYPIDMSPDQNGIAYANYNYSRVGYLAGLNCPYLWGLPGNWIRLGKADHSGMAYAISPNETIAGYVNGPDTSNGDRAALLDIGDHTILGSLPGAGSSYAYGINASGIAVGKASLPLVGGQGYHAVRWDAGGNMTDLGTLAGPGYGNSYYSEARAINARGFVVGSSNDQYGSKCAFLWRPGHGMEDLNYLIPINEAYRWSLNEATAINGAGWIVGKGMYDGKVRGFCLVPVAPPYKMASVESIVLMLLSDMLLD
jgi:probable HAF family extracellular repeat protein